MKRKLFRTSLLLMLIVVLSGCGKTAEEQIDTGVNDALTVFKETPKESNKTIGEIELYVPSGYHVKQSEDLNNYNINKGKDQFILFVNNYEKQDSKLHYELVKKDTSKKIVKEETVEKDGVFGFTAVIEIDEEQYELIASSGGVKMTTISEDKNIDDKLKNMMTIVRSVQMVD